MCTYLLNWRDGNRSSSRSLLSFRQNYSGNTHTPCIFGVRTYCIRRESVVCQCFWLCPVCHLGMGGSQRSAPSCYAKLGPCRYIRVWFFFLFSLLFCCRVRSRTQNPKIYPCNIMTGNMALVWFIRARAIFVDKWAEIEVHFFYRKGQRWRFF